MDGNNDAMAANDTEATDASNHQPPGRVGEFHPMDDKNSDDDAAVDSASTDIVDPKPKSKRKKRNSGAISRYKKGTKQKRSTSPHLPNLPRNPPQPQPTNKKKAADERVFNLKRGDARKAKKIEQLSADNEELKGEVEAAEKDAELTRKECAKKVTEMERACQKESERSAKRLKSAVVATAKAKASQAEAIKAEAEAKQVKKDATKVRIAATNEKKKVNAKAGSLAKKSKKQIDTRDEEIAKLKDLLRQKDIRLREADKLVETLQEELIKETALKDEALAAVEDMEAKMNEMETTAQEESAAGHLVIGRESIKRTGLKRWPQDMVQAVMEYLVAGGSPAAFSKILVCILKIFHPNVTIEGFGDRYAEMQPLFPPSVDEELVDRRIEICETRGEMLHWHSGTVIGIMQGSGRSAAASSSRVQLRYDEEVLDEGEEPIQAVTLRKEYWNKAVHNTRGKGWRWAKEEVEVEVVEMAEEVDNNNNT